MNFAARPRLRTPAARLSPPRLFAPRGQGHGASLPALPAVAASGGDVALRPNPYLDFARHYTAEGGIVYTYKDLDPHLWRTILRCGIWLAATWLAWRYAANHTPLEAPVLNSLGVLAMAAVNWFILFKAVEVYRTVEIRPDCMILEGAEIFWQNQMELGLPRFQKTEEGHQMLCGVYGTRWVEYFTVRRFDELDRTPEVFVAHLSGAMQQQWSSLGRGSG